jgi:cyclopropane-fatty-acyl-phospholipid synthase
MNTRVLPNSSLPAPGFAERLVRRRLEGLVHGVLAVDGATYGRRSERCDLSAAVSVHAAAFWPQIAFGGSVGAGESYMAGHWSADNLTAAMRILAANPQVMDGMETGLAKVSAPLRSLLHWAARNSRNGSRRNISAHYDLGNDFFALFLDPTLMYSSAVFEHPAMTLAEAQVAKLERICRRLDLKPGDHVLEIGTGWGGFAMHAARRHGCHVTTTTISGEQRVLADERIRAAGLEDRVTLLQKDYRDLEGRYDKLVSIEMIEAVGHQYFGTFFAKCGALLAPHGRMLLQAITIADQRYESARGGVDFIKRHIFPGCCIPSVTALAAAATRASDLRLVQLDDIGPHYEITLRHWRENLFRNLAAVRALGHSEAFIRMWEFYFAYCEAGFAERALGNIQALLVKPDARL